MLTVLAVFTVLFAILIPVVSGVRERAHKAKCGSNLRELGSLLLLYSQSTAGRLPDLENPYWDVAAMSIISDENPPAYSDILRCPSDEIIRPVGEPRSYSMNPVLMNYFGMYESSGATSPRDKGSLISNLRSPATTFLLMEHHENRNVYGGGAWIVSTGVNDVHSGGMNVVFCDGHVEFVPEMPRDEFQEKYQKNL